MSIPAWRFAALLAAVVVIGSGMALLGRSLGDIALVLGIGLVVGLVVARWDRRA
jgi:hypothetical protein